MEWKKEMNPLKKTNSSLHSFAPAYDVVIVNNKYEVVFRGWMGRIERVIAGPFTLEQLSQWIDKEAEEDRQEKKTYAIKRRKSAKNFLIGILVLIGIVGFIALIAVGVSILESMSVPTLLTFIIIILLFK